MNIQLIIVICCLIVALVFMGFKVFVSLSSRKAPACSGCNKACAGRNPQSGCQLQELRPEKHD